MKKIPLRQGGFAIVDDEDAELAARYRWRLDSGGYARATIAGGRQILMHRLLLDAPSGMDVDHRDGNRLNNVRANLRLCSRARNTLNRSGGGRTGSIYKGVEWDPREEKWRAAITLNGIRRRSAYFIYENDAARHYNAMARHYHGSYARLNDVPQGKGRRSPDEGLMLDL